MSGLVDRFICRREGHVPTFTITKQSGIRVKSYMTSCRRCGKVYEQAANGEDTQATRAGGTA